MRRAAGSILVIGLVLGIAAAICVTNVAADANDEKGFQKANHALTSALDGQDDAIVSKLLDGDFQWIDRSGKVRSKSQVLRELPAFAENNKSVTETTSLNLGPVERVLGRDETRRFAHVWVKRPQGWRALIYFDTPVPDKEADNTPRPVTPADRICDNPCKTLPYNPATPGEKQVMQAWEKIKMAEWQGLPEEWDARTAPEHVSITAHYLMPKAQRLALLAKQKQTYGWGYAGSPVVTMQMFDFKTALVMITRHTPKSNGKQPCNLRLFVKRGADWKIILSFQNDIAPASAMADK